MAKILKQGGWEYSCDYCMFDGPSMGEEQIRKHMIEQHGVTGVQVYPDLFEDLVDDKGVLDTGLVLDIPDIGTFSIFGQDICWQGPGKYRVWVYIETDGGTAIYLEQHLKNIKRNIQSQTEMLETIKENIQQQTKAMNTLKG